MSAGPWLYDGAGNRFFVADARGAALAEPAALARALCAGGVGAGGAADGLLVLLGARAGGDARLEIWNADGSVALACGNGLRCAAWHLFRERGGEGALAIETAAGTRRAWLVEAERERALVRVEMGRGELRELEGVIDERFPARCASLGNPHCVLLVPDERDAPVAELGRALQTDPRFPGGVNVGFLARRDGGFHLRVYERGVGETLACGSGACAAALTWLESELARAPVPLHLPGGLLTVARADQLLLTGPAQYGAATDSQQLAH